MKFPLYWVDAFSEKPFHGNPAAVVPLEAWPADSLMQQIAFEHNLAETAFFVRTGPDRYHLRWFTPELEMDLCGHATVATAHVLFTQLGQSGDRIVFDSRSGPVVVERRGSLLELDFPSRPPAPVPSAQVPAALLAGLGGRAPDWIGKARDYLCVYSSAAEVLALKPDFTLLNQIDVHGIIVTGPGGEGTDFVSRFFAPHCGVPEDPVTGSSHCTLIPFWAERLGKRKLLARQVSARGGELHCELRGDRVGIAGRAVLYRRGEIEV